MQETLPPQVPKWPFYLSDAILLATAWFIAWQGTLPLGRWEILGSLVCVALGAVIAVLPFVLEYKAVARLAEAATLASGLAQIRHAETIAIRIAEATDNWQAVHEAAGKTAATAREISERRAAEVRDFTQFLQKANDSEKSTLRLEVEKLRRGEAEWLQAVVRILDHVYALHVAAVRSGQPRLIEQLAQFQNACRDAARRLGLAPFVVEPGEAFDAHRHQTPDGNPPPPDAKIADTLATGFTFQGRLVRPAMIALQSSGNEALPAASDEEPRPESVQSAVPSQEQTLL
jgi:molecular chaperone GrpE (heat shock protein)